MGEGRRRRGFFGGEGSGEDETTTWNNCGDLDGECLHDVHLGSFDYNSKTILIIKKIKREIIKVKLIFILGNGDKNDNCDKDDNGDKDDIKL